MKSNEFLLKKYQATKQKGYRDQCIAQTHALAYSVAHAFKKTCPDVPFDDLCAEAGLALVQCAESFIPKSVKFSTYATWQIQFALSAYVKKHRQRGVTHTDARERPSMVPLDDLLVDDRNKPQDAHVAEKEMVELIDNLKLDKEDRKLFHRVFRKGLSDSEIAMEYGITRQAIAKRRESMYARMRDQLQIEGMSDILD